MEYGWRWGDQSLRIGGWITDFMWQNLGGISFSFSLLNKYFAEMFCRKVPCQAVSLVFVSFIRVLFLLLLLPHSLDLNQAVLPKFVAFIAAFLLLTHTFWSESGGFTCVCCFQQQCWFFFFFFLLLLIALCCLGRIDDFLVTLLLKRGLWG